MSVELLSVSSVLVAICGGGTLLLLFYILRLFRNDNGHETNQRKPVTSGHPEKKKETFPSVKPKKKASADRWSNRSDKQNFSSPWLLKSLKGHTGQVLSIDYSSTGKYLASCGEEDPDPDQDMNTSSGSECNKESSPSSNASPRTKGLSRRQRKNRKREDISPDGKKKILKNVAEAKKPLLKQCLRLNITERHFADLLHHHLLTYEQQLIMGYPVQSPMHSNSVVFLNTTNATLPDKHPLFDVNAREFVPNKRNFSTYHISKSGSSESSEVDSESSESSEDFYDNIAVKDEGVERVCVRCGSGFFVTSSEYLTQERCCYHWGKLQTTHKGDRFPVWSCCQGKAGSVGCSTCKLHVWTGAVGGLNGPCEGFVKTRPKKCLPMDGNYGVYALDCEMCFTVAGLEVAKVTVVGMDGRLVYDSYVKPRYEVVDYNTRFSGITAKNLKAEGAKTLKEVQNDLKGFISTNTILIGHGLENDLRALRIIHKNVVDTAWSFPHYHGLPFKRSLKSLVSSYLRREVQCSSNGHSSYEDACACMELMLYKVRKENRGCL